MKRPVEDEVRRLLGLRCRRHDERLVLLQLLQPAFHVGCGAVNGPIHDAGMAAQKRAAEFGDQFLLAVGIGAESVPFRDAGAIQAFFVASRMHQFVKKGGVVAILAVEPCPFWHSNGVIGRGIERLRHAVLDDRRLWHLRHDLSRFGHDKGASLHCRHILQSLALGGIEDVIQAQERDFPLLLRFLVLNLQLFPEYDRTGFFALLHAAAKLDGLAEGEPVR